MTSTISAGKMSRLTLHADTAAELMTPDPVSIRASATIPEAVKLLTDKGYSAAPVIDEAGHPIGVLSRADILVHDREKFDYVAPVPEYYEPPDGNDSRSKSARQEATSVCTDRTRVRDCMTPIVFSVKPEASAREVVEQILALNVHRLFVVDQAGILVGVISALDVLRHLHE
jgi:CBS-domain-containing membrane protein